MSIDVDAIDPDVGSARAINASRENDDHDDRGDLEEPRRFERDL